MNEAPDEGWLRASLAGDAAASKKLVERHFPSILRFSRRMLRDAHEAEDIAQETFLRLWKSGDRVEGGATLRTWLFRVAHNLAIDRIRAKKKVSFDDDAHEEVPASGPSAAAMLHEKERAARVQQAIEALPERQRAAIVLVFHEGLPQTEAASVLGVSVDALESLLARARRSLKKTLTTYDDDEDQDPTEEDEDRGAP